MMTTVKKNYASIMEVQEGKRVPYDKQLDVKGIAVLHKSSTPLSTRKALQKILLEDILRAPVIDQLKFVKDIAILEKQIVQSIKSGSKEFYKPVTLKAMSSYEDPLRIQGVKAAMAWNMIKPADIEAINLDERNPLDIAKVIIDINTIERIADKYPEVYQNMIKALNHKVLKNKKNTKTGEVEQVEALLFDGSIDSVAIPIDLDVPDWLFEFIDTNSIIGDSLNGFPYESIGIQNLNKNIGYTNIVKL